MSRGDAAAEAAAARLERWADGLARSNGLRAKLAADLAADARLVRGMKPSLVRGRLGQSPPQPEQQQDGDLHSRVEAERDDARRLARQLAPHRIVRRLPQPSPLALVAAAFAAGVLLARVLAWRAHAHPR